MKIKTSVTFFSTPNRFPPIKSRYEENCFQIWDYAKESDNSKIQTFQKLIVLLSCCIIANRPFRGANHYNNHILPLWTTHNSMPI